MKRISFLVILSISLILASCGEASGTSARFDETTEKKTEDEYPLANVTLDGVSLTIDGGEPIIVDGYNSSNNPKEVQIATFLDDGSHTVLIELIDDGRKGGNKFEIGALLIN